MKALQWFVSQEEDRCMSRKTTSTFLIALSMTHDILLLIFPDHSLTPMPTETCDAHLGLTVLLMRGKRSETLGYTRSNALIL